MPTYQYMNHKTGVIEEHWVPIDQRDDVPDHLERILVPERIGCLLGKVEPHTAASSVPKAFRELELSGVDCRTIERQSGFSRDHIRRTWNF